MAVLGLCFFATAFSLVVASGGHSSSRCAGLSLSQPLQLRSTGSRRAGSVIVAHGPSCSAACGISPDQGSNLCPLHWQADSQPLCHQGSPGSLILTLFSTETYWAHPLSCLFWFLYFSLLKFLFGSSFFKKKLIYFWLCWVFVAVHGLSLVAASRGYSLL